MNERIKKVRDEFCDGNNKIFAEILGVSPQYASNITKQGKNVGDKVLNSILEKFPSLNPVWLKMGEGAMLKSDKNTSDSDILSIPREVWEAIQAELKAKDEQIYGLISLLQSGNKAGVEDRSLAVRGAAQG